MPNATVFVLCWIEVEPAGGSTDFVYRLLIVRSDVAVIKGCFCDRAIAMSDTLAFFASSVPKSALMAFGVSRLST